MRFFLSGLCGLALAALADRAGARADRASTGRAATTPASRCRPAIRRCARRAATATARCRAWTFSYPGTAALGGSNLATCWLKSQVKPLVENRCCVAGVKGAALVEMRPGPVENAIDRIGGDYRNFEIPANQDVEACKQACEGDNRCRAWTYVRPGYRRAAARCYLKDKITPPRRRPCCMSGVVR